LNRFRRIKHVIGLLCFGIFIGACEGGDSGASSPNILVYLSDTPRADHLSVYGYDRDTSPRLREFAERGVVFERAYSQASWTKASVGTLFTGLYPSRHGAIRREHRLRGDVPTLAEGLAAAGYSTAAVIGNLSVLPGFGFGRGFEQVVDVATERPIVDAAQISDRVLEFLEHGSRTHGYALFEEQIHVPLIMRFPGGDHAGLRVPAPVRVIDLFPTLLELADASIPHDIDGTSFLPLLETSEAGTYEPSLFFEQHRAPMPASISSPVRRERRSRSTPNSMPN